MKNLLIIIVLFLANTSKSEIEDIHIKDLIVPFNPQV